jgi:hypothetical protein
MADIITFDPTYLQELAGDLGNVSKYLGEAKTSLRKASVGLDSGLVAFAMCSKLNDDMTQIKKTAENRISEASGFSKALEGGIRNINNWETTTKNRESGLAAQLGKIWGFENVNFTGETGGTVSDNGAGDPVRKIDIDWTKFMSLLGGLDGLRKAAIENAIKVLYMARH